MYTINPTGLIAEYLFENPIGGVVENTANPGTLNGVINHDAINHPLLSSGDVPPGFIGAGSMNYNVLRRLSDAGNAPQMGFAQYIEIAAFPDVTELTVEAWVKVDYAKADPLSDPAPGTYPDGQIGFGACPQPVCKANSWYLFLSTLQTDRNLILTAIPDNVTQGLPKAADATSGSGGIVSEDIVHGGQWTHIVATVKSIAGGELLLQTYINGIRSHQELVTDFAGVVHNIPNITDNGISPSPGDPLRLGQFRQIQADLDYQFSGMLCGVRIYSRALTQNQVLNDFHQDTCSEVDKGKPETKELKEPKEFKEVKEFKEPKELKELKELKEPKELKEVKEIKEPKEFKEIKEIKEFKEPKEIFEAPLIPEISTQFNIVKPGNKLNQIKIHTRLNNMENEITKLSHFIKKELRPDLSKSALKNEPDLKNDKNKDKK